MKKICKNCISRIVDKDYGKYCENPKLTDDSYGDATRNNANDDVLKYEYSEGGLFFVGDNFGCVHFKGVKDGRG